MASLAAVPLSRLQLGQFIQFSFFFLLLVLIPERLSLEVLLSVLPSLLGHIEDHLGHSKPVNSQFVNLFFKISPFVQMESSGLSADHLELLL